MEEEKLYVLQKEDPDIGVIYRWVVTRKKPKNMQRHVNSFIKTHGKNIQLVNDELVVKAQRHGRDIVQAMIPQSDTPRILQLLHHQSGHFGVAKTQYNVGTRFFWFKWKRDVQDWCRSCKTCLQRKGVHKRDLPPVGQLPIPRQPFQCWHMDFVGPLPKTPGEIGLSFLLRILSHHQHNNKGDAIFCDIQLQLPKQSGYDWNWKSAPAKRKSS